jgi:hypothetical protein
MNVVAPAAPFGAFFLKPRGAPRFRRPRVFSPSWGWPWLFQTTKSAQAQQGGNLEPCGIFALESLIQRRFAGENPPLARKIRH